MHWGRHEGARVCTRDPGKTKPWAELSFSTFFIAYVDLTEKASRFLVDPRHYSHDLTRKVH
jgi:hypothetical protein